MIRFIFTSIILLSSLSVNAQLQYKGYVFKKHVAQSVVSNSGNFLYLTHDHNLSAYKVDQKTGQLKETQQISHHTGGEFGRLVVSADDRFLYASMGMNSSVKKPVRSLVIYSIDQKSGKLTMKESLETNSEFQFEFISHFSVSPKKDLLFIGDNSDQSLKVFRFNIKTGMPEHIYTNTTDKFRLWSDFVLSKDQKNLYVTSSNTNKEVVVYSFDERSGVVQKIQEIEYFDRWCGSSDLIVTPDGMNVYKSSGMDDEKIVQFKRDPHSGMLEFEHSYDDIRPSGKALEIHFLYADRNVDYLYALKSFGEGDAMHVIKRDPSTGNLTLQESFYDKGVTSRLNGVFMMSFSKDNRYVYASGMWDGALNIFYNPNARTPQIYEDEEQTIASTSGDRPINNSETSQPAIACQGDEVTSKEFRGIWKAMESEEYDIPRLEVAYQQIEGKCMKVVQAAALSYLFSSEFKRLEFVKFVSYFLHDQENTHLLAEVFQYDKMKEEVLRL